MINVTDATKSAYTGDSIQKSLTISFPNRNITFTNTDIVSESLEITESIETERYLTFKGCIASQCKFQVAENVQDLRGEYITVSIQAGSTETISLFKGYVDEQNNETHEDVITEFICYDALYKIGSKNMQSWVDGLTYPITVKNFRDSLFSNLGITQETTTLVNDSLTISSNFKTFCDNPSATDIMKWICEANAVFGQMGRDGKFHYRELKTLTKGTYPSETTYPSSTTYPSGENTDIVIESSAYISLTYEPYEIDLISKVTIYDSGGLDIAYSGSGTNVFGITDNPIAFSLSSMATAASNIYGKVGGLNYIPVVNMQCVGMPYMECGDSFLSYTKKNIVRTPILQRTFKGIQALRDDYTSDSDRNRPEHVATTVSRTNANKQTIIDVQADIVNFKQIVADEIQATNAKFNSLDASKITTGTLSADRIAANSISVAKLTGSISKTDTGTGMSAWSINLTDGTMTIGSINADKIKAGTISADRIGANSIGVGKLTGSISKTDTGSSMDSWEINLTNGTMTIGSINANKIKAGTISSARLDSDVITTSNLSAQSINGSQITAGTIKAEKIEAGTITATQIQNGTIDSSKVNLSASDSEGWGVSISNNGTSFSKGTFGVGGIYGTIGDVSSQGGWGVDFGNGSGNGSFHVGHLSADSIDSGYISANLIQAGSLTVDKISSTSLASSDLTVNSIWGGTVHGTNLKVGSGSGRTYSQVLTTIGGTSYYVLASRA